jgi:hypothetical protein
MQLPPVDPAVPTRFGSAGLGIDAGVRHFPAFAVLLVPNPTLGVEGVLSMAAAAASWDQTWMRVTKSCPRLVI